MIRKAERDKQAAALGAVEQQIAKLQSGFSATTLDALNEANANYRLRAEEVKKAEDKAALTTLVSPIDGVVAQLKVHTIGVVFQGTLTDQPWALYAGSVADIGKCPFCAS